jgi:uncharacterized membrane protein
MRGTVLRFVAILLTALALVPVGAHLLELPNKMGLAEEPYFTVQQIYRGWALLGIVLCAAIVADLALAVTLRGEGPPFWLALAGFALMAGTLAIFFAFTFPTNEATRNWTQVPGDWRALRAQWEYSHAVNAAATVVAFCCVTLASLWARPR